VRPIGSLAGCLALFGVWVISPNDSLLRAAVVAVLASAIAIGGSLWLASRVGTEVAVRVSVYVDIVLVALVVSQFPDESTYAIAYMWPIALATLLCTPRDTALITGLSVVVGASVPLLRGSEDFGRIALDAVIIALIGFMLAAVRRDEHRLDRTRSRLERQLRDAQRLAQVGSWEYDARTDTASWSEEMYRILGISERGGLGTAGFLELVVPEDREHAATQMARGIMEKVPTSFQITIRRPVDGELRAIYGVGEPSADDPDVFIGSIQDVTDQRRLEAMRDEFVAAASHELRTPTSIVAGFASTLERSWDQIAEDDRRRYVGEIDRAAQRLSMLIEDVLQVSQIESGNLRCEHVPFDVTAEVGDIVRSWPGMMRIDLDLDDEPRLAVGDAVRTRQVLTNLLANAERHTPEGTHAIVHVHALDGHVQVSVEDDGPGIRPEDQARIFDRFVRLDRTKVGTGLGLYLSRKLAEAQAGTLDVESSPGHGATFTLSLPAAAGRVDA
jgi:PAS domain S-box-containing protein